MIKINKRNDNLPNSLSCQRAIDSTAKIERKALNNTLCSKDFEHEIYGCADVKDKLKTDQYNKCAYCESKLTGDYATVEHYRPKTEYLSEDGTKKLGYYWLAYDWNNLHCSCDICNNASRKGIQFPLRDPSTRDIANKDISKEDPLIINPAQDTPQEHIRFNKYIAFAVSKDGVESDKGRCTIDVFDLNGKAENKPNKLLVEARRRKWQQAELLYKELTSLGKSRDDTIKFIIAFMGQDEDEFAGMFQNQELWP